ncbi:MAG: SPFH domain-containing protein [candidate division Zixibacteria bacterium]|nr:SPFH domain-containing protein [candidate division Zixibacteria bacterium]
MIKERDRKVASGWAMFMLLVVLLLAAVVFLIIGTPVIKIIAGVWMLVDFFLMLGFFFVNPNEGRVLQLFGKYTGTTRQEGLRWANPLLSKKRISLRVRNFETGKMKVNDVGGNPIEIAAIVVWKVVDTAEACFQVDHYEQFVMIQSESAVRNLATQYAYDSHDDDTVSLRGSTSDISDKLRVEIQERLDQAGVEVLEARISHLAYAPEIAEAMLRRQQAGAIVAARQLIVEGAVGMVEMALEQLSQKNIIELDHERKAAMVSNLLVVLCGETATQPVINTGTLYQ